MEEHEKLQEFSLLGGPFHRMGCYLGLVREGTNTVALGLALSAFLWITLVVLTLIEGVGHQVFALTAIGAHGRLLVAIPLLFICEAWVDPRLTIFVDDIVRSGVVPRSALPALDFEIARINRWKDSWVSEAVCMVAAVLVLFIGLPSLLPGVTTTQATARVVSGAALTKQWSWVGHWYFFVCLPLFRFLVFRWVWRLILWFYFLWRISRLDLHLVPTHPDGVAGLGYLEIVHTEFICLVLFISVVQSASFAEELSAGTTVFSAIYPAVALTLVMDVILFLGPLYVFAPKLWLCRTKGYADYMNFAAYYVNAFDKKWLLDDTGPTKPVLGTPDLQSLADLTRSVNVVHNMRLAPVTRDMLVGLIVAALLPMLPLSLLIYPVEDLAGHLFKMLLAM
jgi:hypothetical protein